MIRATPADGGAIIAFLWGHVETSMFPLSNLITHGMDRQHARSMRFWIDGYPIRNLLGISQSGMAMPQAPSGRFDGVAALLEGISLTGITGEAGQVRNLCAALQLDRADAQRSKDEPLFSLTLADLTLPERLEGFDLRPLKDAPRDLIQSWRADYHTETLGTSPARAIAIAASDIENYLAADSHRVLFQNGAPIAMTGFNARLPDAVQIGGVWTPPALRGRGLARRAVGLHLAEARTQGVTRAILFAASQMAARAYISLGFRQIGWFGLMLFESPYMVRHG